ncbi:MAG: cytochrome c biogenesis protein CcsA [Bacteroidia bacterium]|nr:cytochrome c biogenesis protein CcsA [Bacteroidia bacterium]MDW8346402.1 cytochrome c biogenesis protein CcsA [Bacteroidia bacterium]
MMQKHGYKVLSVGLIAYALVWGLLMQDIPYLPILHQTIRNLYYHVPMWFSMTVMMFVSVYYAIMYLRTQGIMNDIKAVAAAEVGLLLGILGLLTGSLWGRYTWGTWWSGDIKLNMSLVAVFIYFAYFILRDSIEEVNKKAKISAAYNIFAGASLVPLLFIIPRLTNSLHPGADDNPAFSAYNDSLNANMRPVFYSSVIGFILFAIWLFELRYKIIHLRVRLEEKTERKRGSTIEKCNIE